MDSLDQRIDALYQLPLAEFTAARNALAKTLTGDHVKDVRALKKPMVVPWAINQLFGRARPIYDRVLAKGQTLRAAQLASLKGLGRKKADVLSATEAHRKAIAEAVHRATQLSTTAGVRPDAELLAKTLEALSIAASPPSTPGRLTDILQPPGFEALAGVTIAGAAAPSGTRKREPAPPRSATRQEELNEARQRQAEAQVHEATRELERARNAESTARKDLDRATNAVRLAEKALAAAREQLAQLRR